MSYMTMRQHPQPATRWFIHFQPNFESILLRHYHIFQCYKLVRSCQFRDTWPGCRLWTPDAAGGVVVWVTCCVCSWAWPSRLGPALGCPVLVHVGCWVHVLRLLSFWPV